MHKIVLLTSISSIKGHQGGSEESLRLLIEQLIDNDYQVYLISFPRNLINIANKVKSKKHSWFSIIELLAPAITLIPRIFFNLKQCEKKGFKICHVYNVFAMAGAGFYKYFGGKITIIGTLNNYAGVCPSGHYLCNDKRKCNIFRGMKCVAKGRNILFKFFSPLYVMAYPLIKKLMKNLDGYIAISDSIKNIYVSCGYKSKKINVIPNFVEIVSCKEFKKDGDTFRVLYAGGLNEHKGVDILILAFCHFAKKRSNCILTIVGDGPSKDKYLKLVKELGINNKVFFAGKVKHDKIWKYYQDSTIFVHPGMWSEPFGRTILEAMSFGLPCVVSDVGAPPEIVGKAGLKFAKGNVNSLYQCLDDLYCNKELIEQLKTNIPERLANYRPKKTIDSFIKYYDYMISSSK